MRQVSSVLSTSSDNYRGVHRPCTRCCVPALVQGTDARQGRGFCDLGISGPSGSFRTALFWGFPCYCVIRVSQGIPHIGKCPFSVPQPTAVHGLPAGDYTNASCIDRNIDPTRRMQYDLPTLLACKWSEVDAAEYCLLNLVFGVLFLTAGLLRCSMYCPPPDVIPEGYIHVGP